MLCTNFLITLFIAATTASGLVETDSHHACSSARFNLENATSISVSHHSKGEALNLPNLVESCKSGYKLNFTNNLCRVVVNVSTSATSTVRLEAWLPDEWNGRFLAHGTGGIGGCIDYNAVGIGAQLGFATLGTNAGHDGSSGFDFFLDHPEVLKDFGYRSIHIEAVFGKQIVKQYYGKGAKKNYYKGCSTGGRQGFQNAHLYPDDFDGIITGAPGIDWLHIVASKGILARRIGWPYLNSSAYVRPEQWPAIVEQQIKMLDPLDGVTDGIIDDPTRHRFDPEVLACGTGVLNETVCLNAGQVNSVRSAYLPIANTAGQIVYPAFELGSDTSVFSNNQQNGEPRMSYSILQDFWRGAVYNDSTWTPLNFNETDMDAAIRINPGQVNAGETDLSAFYKRGGKIISYHGRNDETVTSMLSMQYFSGVQQSGNFTLEQMNSFYRLFFIPGMHHCQNGPGAWSIGQQLPLDPNKLDSKHNILLALVDWVENKSPPVSLVGTKYQDDVSGGLIQAQRKLCSYPSVSKWDGHGNTKLASSWICQPVGT